MDAIERVIKTLNHEEPDRVPSFEIEIDNYNICHHFGEEYIYHGMVKYVSDTYEILKGDTNELTKTLLYISETRRYLKNVFSSMFGLYSKIGIDFFASMLTGHNIMPSQYNKNSFIDELGKVFDLKRNTFLSFSVKF